MISIQSGRFLVKLLPIMLLAGILGGVGTRLGPGLTPDTILYLDAADSVRLWGQYPVTLMGGSRSSAEIAPLYPLALAAVGAGLDTPGPARWLNVGLYALNVGLFGLLLRRMIADSDAFALAGAALVATSLVLLEIHTAAWSEPIFLLLQLAWVWALAEYLDRPTWRRLLIAGSLVGLCPLCRLAGITSIAAALLTVALCAPRSWRHWAVFGVLSCGPLLLMLKWNAIRSPQSPGVGNGGLPFRWPGEDLAVLWNTVAAWLIPGIDRFNMVPLQDILALVLVLTWVTLLVVAARANSDLRQTGLFRVAAVHTVAYPLVVIGLVSTIKTDLPLEQRIMMPMHVTMLLVSLSLLARYRGKKLCLVFLACWLILYVIPSAVGTGIMATSGRGYLGVAYQAPDIYAYLREHPPKVLHSNDGTAVRFFLRRQSAGIDQDRPGPILFFRVGHPLPPRHAAGTKRSGPPVDALAQLVAENQMKLQAKQGSVELYLPAGELPAGLLPLPGIEKSRAR